jgi:uncharacterized protein YbjT (DUF2867 family)
MRILITGANGFIGRHIAALAVKQGHTVLRGVRRAHHGNEIACDFERDTDSALWCERLQKVDAVINCVGILRGMHRTMQRVHCDTPAALASACHQTGVALIHISVLNLEQAPATAYFASKRAGEAAIRSSNAAATLLRPSLVFGSDSPASRLLALQSALPLIVVPRHSGPIAPIHVDDLAALALTLAGTLRAQGCDVPAVGRSTVSMAEFLTELRCATGHKPAPVLHLPNALMRMGMQLAGCLPGATACTQAMDLIEHAHAFEHWLHHKPRGIEQFFLTPFHSEAPPVKVGVQRQV